MTKTRRSVLSKVVHDESDFPRAIELRGIRQHNLKGIDLDIPLYKLVVLCGVSGSGKTSLAIDTLYAEGQRRFVECFSPYTRQFLERLDKPDYDRIDNLPPATAVAKQSVTQSNRSTVGSSTEIADFLRLAMAKIGRLYCPSCQDPIVPHSPQSVANHLHSLSSERTILIATPMTWEDRTDLAHQLADLQQTGFVRLSLAGKLVHLARDDRKQLAESIPLSGEGWVIVDRVRGGTASARTIESLESAFRLHPNGIALLVQSEQAQMQDDSDPESSRTISIDEQSYALQQFGRRRHCFRCNQTFPDPEPRLFSFNSPIGACPACEGFGDKIEIDMDLVVPDRSKSIRDGAIAPWNTPSYRHELEELLALAEDYKIPVDVPFDKVPKRALELIQHGVPARNFGGLDGFFQWLERKKYKLHVRVYLSRWRSYSRCDACLGKRLQPHALAYRIADKNLADIMQLQIDQAFDFLSSFPLEERDRKIASEVLDQACSRLRYLQMVGLGYLSLERSLRTLSGGEAQRVALTTALGSSLSSMLYVLDEPTVGLHPSDTEKLVEAILSLRDRGNTVVVVEHEPPLMERADWIVEIGPEAGVGGGQVVFQGTPKSIQSSKTLTGQYLANARYKSMQTVRRKPNRGTIELLGASGNNLKIDRVAFPLGMLCVVTGVSGSGKSSLIQDTLFPALHMRKTKGKQKCLPYLEVLGDGQIDEVVQIDQEPVGKSPRSVPVTFIKAFDEIRNAFAASVDAKTRNYTSSHFSFNHELGRCDHCEGSGWLEIDMQFLADIQMKCPVCHGRRYRQEILQVRLRDRSIADVLEMTAIQAKHFFRGQAKVQERLQVLCDVGLDYLTLGQPANTLSAGESQRLKLAAQLRTTARRGTLYLLDEPTTGLHFHDVTRLLDCFSMLIEAGHSLIVVEHNEQLIRAADHIIDLGPGAAENGGQIIAQGTPEEIAAHPNSRTGKYLRNS